MRIYLTAGNLVTSSHEISNVFRQNILIYFQLKCRKQVKSLLRIQLRCQELKVGILFNMSHWKLIERTPKIHLFIIKCAKWTKYINKQNNKAINTYKRSFKDSNT